METGSGLMKAVKLQNSPAEPQYLPLFYPLCRVLQSSLLQAAVGAQDWTRLAEGSFGSDNHLENHHSRTMA